MTTLPQTTNVRLPRQGIQLAHPGGGGLTVVRVSGRQPHRRSSRPHPGATIVAEKSIGTGRRMVTRTGEK